MIPNGDLWAAKFLRGEPDYGELDWLDTYAMVFSRCKPELTPQEVAEAARAAYVRESWCNPKVSAGLDAMLGPVDALICGASSGPHAGARCR
jgi:hypothetical protein